VSERSISIGRQLGAIYLLVVALLVTVCVVVVAHLRNMRNDARRLLEETEEHAVTSRISVQMETLRGILAGWPADDQAAASGSERARELIVAVDEGLHGLRGEAGKDPSREEHQELEDTQVAAVRRDLAECLALLAGGTTPAERARAGRLLQDASVFAASLHAETYEESRAANRDLTTRGRQARGVMVLTVVVAALALALALAYVLRSIVRPLRVLTRGAERFGHGDLTHRIPVTSRDEVGELARAFNAMADRIAEARTDLEARVDARTREFLRAARLADLGVLAAGVAHEVNNPLASIASCAEGLERRVRSGHIDEPEQLEYLRTIAAEAYRAREITGQLLSLAAQERDEAAPVDVALVLRQVQVAVRHLLEKRGLELEVAAPDGLTFPGQGSELMQILMNLVLNARDASPAGGRITVDARREDDEVVLEVADRGEGVPEEDVERIFDPFFTTKRPGNGTGLGLSVVAALVEARGGHIAVDARPGGGARFRVRFPALAANAPTSADARSAR
jgi:signal transduction histidine kinase